MLKALIRFSLQYPSFVILAALLLVATPAIACRT